jgi:hypothetical protein
VLEQEGAPGRRSLVLVVARRELGARRPSGRGAATGGRGERACHGVRREWNRATCGWTQSMG